MACTSSPARNNKEHKYGTIVTGDSSIFNNALYYTWHPLLIKTYLNNEKSSEATLHLLQSAIDNELSNKGYIKTRYDVADFVIGLGVARESKLSDGSIYQKTELFIGVDKFYSAGKQVEKGTVFIGIFHKNRAEPSWKVLAQGNIDENRTQSERQRTVEELTMLMLRSIPIKSDN